MMDDELYRLVYTSKNEIKGDDAYIRNEIQQILEVARTSNIKMGVTGALMFNSGCFAQVLEGQQDNVQEIFERIQCDIRHSDVIILDFAPVTVRGFTCWSMAYLGDNESSNDEFRTIADDTDFDPLRLSGDRIFDALHHQLVEMEALSKIKNAA